MPSSAWLTVQGLESFPGPGKTPGLGDRFPTLGKSLEHLGLWVDFVAVEPEAEVPGGGHDQLQLLYSIEGRGIGQGDLYIRVFVRVLDDFDGPRSYPVHAGDGLSGIPGYVQVGVFHQGVQQSSGGHIPRVAHGWAKEASPMTAIGRDKEGVQVFLVQRVQLAEGMVFYRLGHRASGLLVGPVFQALPIPLSITGFFFAFLLMIFPSRSGGRRMAFLMH